MLWQQGPERLTFKVGVTHCLSSVCDLCEVEPASFPGLVRCDFYEVSLGRPLHKHQTGSTELIAIEVIGYSPTYLK